MSLAATLMVMVVLANVRLEKRRERQENYPSDKVLSYQSDKNFTTLL